MYEQLDRHFWLRWGVKAYKLCIDGGWSTQEFVDFIMQSQPVSEYGLVLEGFANAALDVNDSETVSYTSATLKKIRALASA